MTTLSVRAFDARRMATLLTHDERVQMLGHALDRPVLEALIRTIARGSAIATSGRQREELAHAAILFCDKNKDVRRELNEAIIDASRLERAKIESLGENEWQTALLPYFSQKRAGAKFLLAIVVMAVCESEPWAVRAQHWIEQLRQTAKQQAETMRRAEQAGVADALVSLQSAVAAESTERSALAEKLNTVELERAAVVAQLGKRESELKRLVEQSQALERELTRLKSSRPASAISDEEQTNALRSKLRKLEKMTSFAREREQERQLRKLLESERDMLLREVGILRTQLQLAQQISNLQHTHLRPTVEVVAHAPKAVVLPLRDGVALFVDGANVAGAARNLHDRKVDFGKLKDVVLGPRSRGAEARAYVIDNGSPGYGAFHRSLVRTGYSVHKRVPKELPDGRMKADHDLQIAVDAMLVRDRVHTVVLVSGDSDFVPLVVELKRSGIRVEAAMFRARSARELIDAVDAFIPLGDEILV